MAACALCLSSLPIVESSGRCQGGRATSLVASWAPTSNSSNSSNSSVFGRSPALHMASRGRSPGPERTAARRNVILSMAKDDALAKMAKDLQTIEEFMPDFDELDKDELEQFLDLELESSLDYETFRHYEIMFLIHEKNADEVQDVIKMVRDFITENKGKIYRLNDWGMRSLAYDIKKAKKANYVLMNFEISSQPVNGLNFLLEKDERVIRHMIMSQKAAITEESVPPEEYRLSRDAEEEDEEYEEWDDEKEDEDNEEQEETELALQRE